MKLIGWVLLGFTISGVAFWIVTNSSVPPNPLITVLFVLIFSIGPIGAFWMMYMSVRHEDHPIPMLLLAFVPYSFVWYYFEHVRRKKTNTTTRLA